MTNTVTRLLRRFPAGHAVHCLGKPGLVVCELLLAAAIPCGATEPWSLAGVHCVQLDWSVAPALAGEGVSEPALTKLVTALIQANGARVERTLRIGSDSTTCPAVLHGTVHGVGLQGVFALGVALTLGERATIHRRGRDVSAIVDSWSSSTYLKLTTSDHLAESIADALEAEISLFFDDLAKDNSS